MDRNDIRNAIESAEKVLIIPSHPIDFDCIGSGLILKKFLESKGKRVKIIISKQITSLDEKTREIYSSMPFFDEIEFIDSREINPNDFDLLFLLDGANLIQFYDSSKSQLNPLDLSKFKSVIHIDHHTQHPEELGNMCIYDPHASSTTELILKNFIKDSFITNEIALLGYAAIVSDTGNFRWKISASTFYVTAKLLEKNIDYNRILNFELFTKSKSYLEYLPWIIESLEYDEASGIMFFSISHEKQKELSISSEKLSEIRRVFQDNIAAFFEGYPIGIMIVQRNEKDVSIYAKGNNYSNKINLPKLFMPLGGNGGGHFHFCSVVVPLTIENAKNSIKELVIKEISTNK